MVIPASCQKFLNDAKSLEAQITKIQSSPGYIQRGSIRPLQYGPPA